MPITKAGIDAVVTIPHAGFGIAFQTITGGEQTSDSVKDRAPGQRFPMAIPAPVDVTNIIVTNTYDPAVWAPLLPHIRGAHADGIECVVGRVRRDGRGNAIGMTTYMAYIVRVTEPEGDSNAAGDKATVEIEFVVSGAANG